VISSDSIDRYYERIGSVDKSKVWVEKSGHLVLEDYAKDRVFAHILEFIRTHIPESAALTPLR
jgi:esterase/lipase